MERMSRRHFTRWAIAAGLAGNGSGCGTFLYPERRGQPAGPLDWKVVALNTIGLLFFFVPGVIAFAVDFATGTIYLPSESSGQSSLDKSRQQLVSVKSRKGKLTAAQLEEIVSAHAGRDVRLNAGDYQTRNLDHLDDFWVMRDRLETGVPESLSR
jgi:hypothetical protein